MPLCHAEEGPGSPIDKRSEYERFLIEYAPLSCRFRAEYRAAPALRDIRERGEGTLASANAQDLQLGAWAAAGEGIWASDGIQWRVDNEDLTRISLCDGSMTIGINTPTLTASVQPQDTLDGFALPQNLLLWAAGRPLSAVLGDARPSSQADGSLIYEWKGESSPASCSIELDSIQPYMPRRIVVDYPGQQPTRVLIEVVTWQAVEGLHLPELVLRRHSAVLNDRLQVIAEQRTHLADWRHNLPRNPFLLDLPVGLRVRRIDGSQFTIGTESVAPGHVEQRLVEMYVEVMRHLRNGGVPTTVAVDLRRLSAAVTSAVGHRGAREISPDVRCAESAWAGLWYWYKPQQPAPIAPFYPQAPGGVSLRELSDAVVAVGVPAKWEIREPKSILSLEDPFVLQLGSSAEGSPFHFVLGVATRQEVLPGKIVVYDHPGPASIVNLETLYPRLRSVLVTGRDVPPDPDSTMSTRYWLARALYALGAMSVALGILGLLHSRRRRPSLRSPARRPRHGRP
jgi:hypothetical protein